MGSIAARTGTWDEASSPAATRLARRFEDAWKASHPANAAQIPLDYLPGGPEATPAAWLALLRADLNLRWDAGEAVRVECYRDARVPGLDAETLVALCYEEFCRREEDGDAPFPSEYDERFPDLAQSASAGSSTSTSSSATPASTDLHVPGPELVPFPETAQTIAGFHLVEELGRGSFARVFLAQERQLADRPVALKVAKDGLEASRKPWPGSSIRTSSRSTRTGTDPVDRPAPALHALLRPGHPGPASWPTRQARVAPTGTELLAGAGPARPRRRLRPGEARPPGPRWPCSRSTGPSPGGGPGWPRPWPTPTTGGFCTGTSSRRTSW